MTQSEAHRTLYTLALALVGNDVPKAAARRILQETAETASEGWSTSRQGIAQNFAWLAYIGAAERRALDEAEETEGQLPLVTVLAEG